jgi:hypothetical protein
MSALFTLCGFDARHENGDELVASLENLCDLIGITQRFAFYDSEPNQGLAKFLKGHLRFILLHSRPSSLQKSTIAIHHSSISQPPELAYTLVPTFYSSVPLSARHLPLTRD